MSPLAFRNILRLTVLALIACESNNHFTNAIPYPVHQTGQLNNDAAGDARQINPSLPTDFMRKVIAKLSNEMSNDLIFKKMTRDDGPVRDAYQSLRSRIWKGEGTAETYNPVPEQENRERKNMNSLDVPLHLLNKLMDANQAMANAETARHTWQLLSSIGKK